MHVWESVRGGGDFLSLAVILILFCFTRVVFINFLEGLEVDIELGFYLEMLYFGFTKRAQGHYT